MNKKLSEDDVKRAALILSHPDVFPLREDLRKGLVDVVLTGVIPQAFGLATTVHVLGRSSMSNRYYAANFLRCLWHEDDLTSCRRGNTGPDRAEFDRIARSHNLIP